MPLMPRKPPTRSPFWLVAIAIPLLVAGCGKGDGPALQDTSVPTVEVMAAVVKPVEQQVTFMGRVAAVDKVELRAGSRGFSRSAGSPRARR